MSNKNKQKRITGNTKFTKITHQPPGYVKPTTIKYGIVVSLPLTTQY